MLGNAWKCLEMLGNAWKCLEMLGNAWKCLEMLDELTGERKSEGECIINLPSLIVTHTFSLRSLTERSNIQKTYQTNKSSAHFSLDLPKSIFHSIYQLVFM